MSRSYAQYRTTTRYIPDAIPKTPGVLFRIVVDSVRYQCPNSVMASSWRGEGLGTRR